MKLRMQQVIPLVALLISGCASDGAEHVKKDAVSASEAVQAERIAAAKQAASSGVIADIYVEWQAASAEYQLRYPEMLEAAMQRIMSTRDKPVRSLDELLSEKDPAGHDSVLRAFVDDWESTCSEYEQRLRELGNDPSTDPRSPLRETGPDE